VALKRAENCSVSIKKSRLRRKSQVWFKVGKNLYDLGKVPAQRVNRIEIGQRDYPAPLLQIGERSYWRFADRYWWDNDGHSARDVYALLMARLDRDRANLNRAQASLNRIDAAPSRLRRHIPDDVRRFVFRRDGGRCSHCGAEHELQLDHIIPVSRGGSSVPENLQVLCGPCNRRKSNT
jgi:hypothetical protein